MKTRLLIIIGVIIALGSVSVIVMIETYQGQLEWKEKVGGLEETKMITAEIVTIPSAKEFLRMDCDDLTYYHPEFSSEEITDAWNTRMHECQNEQEQLPVLIELKQWRQISCLGILHGDTPEFKNNISKQAFDIRWNQCSEIMDPEMKGPGISNGIWAEMNYLQKMTCDEIIQRNTEGEYLSDENREFAREKVLGCSDTEEFFAKNAPCENLYERYHMVKNTGLRITKK
jgi:hypothetical protein